MFHHQRAFGNRKWKRGIDVNVGWGTVSLPSCSPASRYRVILMSLTHAVHRCIFGPTSIQVRITTRTYIRCAATYLLYCTYSMYVAVRSKFLFYVSKNYRICFQ